MDIGLNDWINTLHVWLQEAAFRILSNKMLTEADYPDLVALIKAPPKPNQSSHRNYPSASNSSSNTNIIRLLSIGDVKGIDNLNPRVPLIFGTNNLTVVYGNNGTGKSSYTRILKRVCGKAGAAELRPNVYKAAPSPSARTCKISYSLNGTLKDPVWNVSDAPLDELKCIDIFDAKAGRIYTEGETEISYEPAELTFFSDLVDACTKVEKLLKAEKEKLVCALPVFPASLKDTLVAKLYIALSSTTSSDQLSKLYPWTDADTKQKASLEERLKTSDPASEARKLRETKAQIIAIETSLTRAIDAVSTTNLQNIKQKYKSAQEKRKAATDGAKVLECKTATEAAPNAEAAAELEGVGSDTWRALWQAARMYSKEVAYPLIEFPNTTDGARCVLCHQPLNEAAKKRLTDFEVYITGKLETDASEAEDALKKIIEELPEVPEIDQLTTSCKAASLSSDLTEKVQNAWVNIKQILDAIGTDPSSDLIPPLSKTHTNTISELNKLSISTEVSAVKYDSDAKLFDREKATDELNELKAKEWTAQQKMAIENEINRQKNVSKYDDYIKTTRTTNISKKADVVSEVLITQSYIDRFNSELIKLGAKRISVKLIKTRSSKGRPKHQVKLNKVIGTAPNLSDVLSDGELRIVSIAAFLADVTGKTTPAPFVFDDPISSLDQTYEMKVADRLIELSKDRQVLVFTHRLSLFGLIVENKVSPADEVCIRLESWGAGEPGQVPFFAPSPEKALRNIKNDRLCKAKKTYKEQGIEAYRADGKAICSDIRILVERIVEKTLLADVILRHRRDIMTKGKIGNLAKIKKSDCDIIDEFMTKYSCYEHSQSEEAPIEILPPQDIESDIDKLLAWHSEFSNRAV